MKGSGNMLLKVADYKGVIIFYLLLGLFLFALSCQSRLVDMQASSNEINTVIANN